MIGSQFPGSFPGSFPGDQTNSSHDSAGEQNIGYKELAEYFSLWLPYLSQGCCESCSDILQSRIQNLASSKIDGPSTSNGHTDCSTHSERFGSPSSSLSNENYESSPGSSNRVSEEYSVKLRNTRRLSSVIVSQRSYTDSSNSQAYEDDLVMVDQPNNREESVSYEIYKEIGLSRDESEEIRFKQVGRKNDFIHSERINGRMVNVLEGLELHTRVFNPVEQKKIVDYVYKLQAMGRQGRLKERTYSEPRRWMRGKGRVTIQFGCCYNYAVDKNGNPPGIIRDEEVDPIPSFFKTVIKRLVRWHVLPPTCVPNSCIVNIYDAGDCIPPHIDHHDFVRPFCTASFLTEADILFGSSLKIVGPGEFSGPVKLPLPVGSVLILRGNGADVAKHCVPSVPAKRISITFRKMDDSKLPYRFKPDPDFEGVRPFVNPSNSSPGQQAPLARQVSNRKPQVQPDQLWKNGKQESEGATSGESGMFHMAQSDFPPLGGLSPVNSRQRTKRQHNY